MAAVPGATVTPAEQPITHLPEVLQKRTLVSFRLSVGVTVTFRKETCRP